MTEMFGKNLIPLDYIRKSIHETSRIALQTVSLQSNILNKAWYRLPVRGVCIVWTPHLG